MTRFHAARPSLRWSSEASFRATWYGSLYVVDTVAASPMCSVRCESAPSSVKGSVRMFTTWSMPESKRSQT